VLLLQKEQPERADEQVKHELPFIKYKELHSRHIELEEHLLQPFNTSEQREHVELFI
jgi:hypothetical protein